jgi:hypothetical protein
MNRKAALAQRFVFVLPKCHTDTAVAVVEVLRVLGIAQDGVEEICQEGPARRVFISYVLDSHPHTVTQITQAAFVSRPGCSTCDEAETDKDTGYMESDKHR